MTALQIGASARRTRTVTRHDIALFTEITGDRNPIHYDEDLARASRFGGLVVQGGVTSGLLNAVVAYVVLGVGPAAAALALLYVTAFNLVAHADLRTPWWLGFLVQRPEMHRVHHERGAHANNYGLPLWDLLFGTWRNPEVAPAQCGFGDDTERLIGQMLLLRDVDG